MMFYWAAVLAALVSCNEVPQPQPGTEPEDEPVVLPKAMVVSAAVDGKKVPVSGSLGDVSTTPVIQLSFTREVKADEKSLSSVTFSGGALKASVSGNDASLLLLEPVEALEPYTTYSFKIAAGECFGVNLKEEYGFSFTTAYSSGNKFEPMSDEELMTLVQRQTFKYFWDYGHPVSGLARERLGSGDTVTSGGSGFGIMTLPVAVERGFVTREQAAGRLRTILDFLLHKAQRFHGVYSHWLNGSTGTAIAFSQKDNGADLVETAFLVQGLLAVQQYFDAPGEEDIRSSIESIWRDVEWDWFTRSGQDVLYWHWSPNYEWEMNMPIRGWNEAMIVYVLAASSPTHPVSANAYHRGWAQNGSMRNDYKGPLFFTHYSFLGLDPHGLKDKYADYWSMNVAHARYNYNYCVANKGGHAGYSADCWGLTASDIPGGYSASSPSNDLGVIAPTAALASMPYLPEESIAAMRHFYYVLGDSLWGDYGFKDAFCLDSGWFAPSYLAIDQGPIVVMIENHRSGLLWNCFMKNKDVLKGLETLGISR